MPFRSGWHKTNLTPIAAELLLESPEPTVIWRWLAVAGILVAIAFTTRMLSFQVSHLAAFKLEVILRTALTEHLAKVALGYVITTGSGAIKKLVQDDVKSLHAFVADSTPLIGQAYTIVFQDTFLLHDTIGNNIKLGRPDATDDEVEAAARAAQAHEFILSLPNGYNTIAGERGTWLSGGQRQRITIARAILQDNPIVVLDEATAFADPENEALIQQAIASLTQGKTLIVIAHRLTTITNADRIAVLDRGRLVELGTHDELVASDKVYARLWSRHQQAQNWELKA